MRRKTLLPVVGACLWSMLAAWSAPAPVPAVRNLALPAQGGTFVLFTSRAPTAQVGHLVDGRTNTAGWRSRDGYLPQDFVLAFEGDRVAEVEKLVLHPQSAHPRPTWPTNFVVAASRHSPLEGFEDVGEFTLEPQARRQEFKIGRPARFLKIRLTRNGGGPFTSLGEIEVWGRVRPPGPRAAGAAPATPAAPAAPGQQGEVPAMAAGADLMERESNNAPDQANPLPVGRVLGGAIDPGGETDWLRLEAGSVPTIATFTLAGRPNLRTSLELLDAAGQPWRRFDPGKVAAERAEFSWLIPPGDRLVRLTEPPVSMVLVWDTSDSMKQDLGKLQQAVEAYLASVRPSERLKLIRFSKDVEVITTNWLSDPRTLRQATAGKFKPINGTSCHDAIVKAISLLKDEAGNRAIILMTDGADTSSVLDHPGLWRQLEAARIRLYTIALGSGMKRYLPATGTVAGRVLDHAALAMNGRSFFTTNATELRQLYQTIAAEVQATSGYEVRVDLAEGHGRLALAATGEPLAMLAAPPQIELVLDCSGSMTLDAGGRPRMAVAKEALTRIIDELPDSIRVALRFYGHRIEDGKPGACEDTELVFPFGPVDKPRLRALVRDVQPVGTTPIAHTLRQLAGDFAGAAGDKVVVLVTDGKEECQGDPAEAVRSLQTAGVRFRLDIVGFALSERTPGDRKAKREMEAVATLGGGRFYDAKNAEGLNLALQATLAVPYEVRDAAGVTVARGLTGQGDLSVPEGIFTVLIQNGPSPITIPQVRIRSERTTRIALRKEGSEVGIQVQGP
ncbi:MAG: hypothetical protein RJA22_2102 [Verrucomicrobiota bacterium]|jgi:Mg-chelatase subunit ChlD